MICREFVQLAVGGPLTGLAFGIATTFWLRFMYNSPMAEITLTIVSAYSTYIVADELLHVSAVLAVVLLGEWLSHACNVFPRKLFCSLSNHRSIKTLCHRGSFHIL